MNFGDINPREFADSMFGPEDERKETCIHCGKEWYSIHYKDGVCHSCQQVNLPGREKLKKIEKRKLIVGLIVIAILTYFLFF